MYFYLFASLPCIPCFLGILEDLRGSGRVWQLTSVPPTARQKYSVLEGLEGGIAFHVLLLDLLSNLELLEDSLAYKPLCYCMQAFVCKEYLGNIICACINK